MGVLSPRDAVAGDPYSYTPQPTPYTGNEIWYCSPAALTDRSCTSGNLLLSGLPIVAGSLQVNGAVTGAGFAAYLASPPAIGGTAPNAGAFTTLSASSTVSGAGFSTYLASPPAIGGTAPNAGSFTTLSASSTVSGAGFSTYLASPPAIGGTVANAGSFTTLSATGALSGSSFGPVPRLLATLTASASANLQDTTSLTATYREYDVFVEYLVAATNAVTCQIAVQASAAFQVTGYKSSGLVSSAASTANSSPTTYIPCSYATNVASGGGGVSGWFHISSPSDTTHAKMFYGKMAYLDSAGNADIFEFMGFWNTTPTAAITGLQFSFSTGNITSGNVYIYGHN